jgi:hypothetical protein
MLPLLIELNPTLLIFKIAEVSTQVKIGKEKLTLLDCIIKHIELFHHCQRPTRPNKKASAIVRMMCLHIANSSNR